jgi:hypothetical protein
VRFAPGQQHWFFAEDATLNTKTQVTHSVQQDGGAVAPPPRHAPFSPVAVGRTARMDTPQNNIVGVENLAKEIDSVPEHSNQKKSVDIY